MQVSSPALTALDLLSYPQASAGFDNVATVLSDMGRKIDPKQLAVLSDKFERSVVQRLGYLLDRMGYDSLADRMRVGLSKRGSRPWTELDSKEVLYPDFMPEPIHRDQRWRVIVRRMPELDE